MKKGFVIFAIAAAAGLAGCGSGGSVSGADVR